MIAFATQAVRESPGTHSPYAANSLALRERGLFAVAMAYSDCNTARDAASAIIDELSKAHAELLNLEKCFARANLRFAAHDAAHPSEWTGGASLVAASIDPKGKAILAHTGEVTAFRIHDDGVERLAHPHNLDTEREKLGLPSADPDLAKFVLRSLGSPNWRPDVVTFELVPGDRLALMTRTVADVTPHSIRAEILRGPLEHAARKLVDALVHNQVGACVVVHFEA